MSALITLQHGTGVRFKLLSVKLQPYKSFLAWRISCTSTVLFLLVR